MMDEKVEEKEEEVATAAGEFGAARERAHAGVGTSDDLRLEELMKKHHDMSRGHAITIQASDM